MNRREATEILRAHLAQYRALSYEELCALIEASPLVGDALAPTGTRYEIQVHIVQDGAEAGVRVLASIDDRGWRAMAPMKDGFTVTPDGAVRDHVPRDGAAG
jgi:hypothetical protein